MREKMKREAARRLETLSLHESVLNKFLEKGIVYYSDRTTLGNQLFGTLYWLSSKPEWAKIVKDIESRKNIFVYHLTHEYTNYGECLSMLYVSNHEEDWRMDRKYLKDVREGVRYVYAYVYNLTDPSSSEYGLVGIKEAEGGLVRTT